MVALWCAWCLCVGGQRVVRRRVQAELQCGVLTRRVASAACLLSCTTCPDHAFHFHCISRWLKTRQVCPLGESCTQLVLDVAPACRVNKACRSLAVCFVFPADVHSSLSRACIHSFVYASRPRCVCGPQTTATGSGRSTDAVSMCVRQQMARVAAAATCCADSGACPPNWHLRRRRRGT